MNNNNLPVPELVDRKVLRTGSIPLRIQLVEFELSPVPELVEGNKKKPFPITLAFEPTTQRAKGKRGEDYIFSPFDKLRDQMQIVKVEGRGAGNFALYFDLYRDQEQIAKAAGRREGNSTTTSFDMQRDQIQFEMFPVNRIVRFETVPFNSLGTYSEKTYND